MSSRGVLPLVVAAFAFVGCGNSPADEAAQPVETYFDALADGDGERACDQLAGEAQRELVVSAAEELPELGVTTCAETVEAVSGIIGPDEESRLRNAEMRVEVNGDTATVTPESGTDSADVAKVDGRWLIVGGLSFR